MTALSCHRLDGLEPDNLLAFLALLGLLRALESDDRSRADADKARPRAAWDVGAAALRPRLFLSLSLTKGDVTKRVAGGLRLLAETHDFNGRKDLNFSQSECRDQLTENAERARFNNRDQVDLLSALMSDAAIKDEKT
jgi:hypothetical protein